MGNTNSVNENKELGSSEKGADAVAGLSGRELDAAVAERVMGHKLVDGMLPIGCPDRLPACEVMHRRPIPRYSKDIAAAMEVWDKLVSDGWLPRLLTMVDGYVVNLHHRDSHDMEQVAADTREEAICRAALATTP